MGEITEALKIRFGTSIRQARDKLASLRRAPRQTLHELGSEIQRLVRLAYPQLQCTDQEDMAMDSFSKALDNKAVQRHLLAIQPRNLAMAIKGAEEFFQVGDSPTRVSTLEQEETTPTTAPPPQTEQAMLKILETVQQLLAKQAEVLASAQEKAKATRPPVKCFNCQGPHFKRNCPKLDQAPNTRSGNGRSPDSPLA